MRRLTRTLICSGVAVALAACSDSGPTGPAVAPTAAPARSVGILSAPAPTASCTVVQLGDGQYEATVTWTALSAVSVDLLNGINLLARTIFSHPIRSGSLTDTLGTAPTNAEVFGQRIGAKVVCN